MNTLKNLLRAAGGNWPWPALITVFVLALGAGPHVQAAASPLGLQQSIAPTATPVPSPSVTPTVTPVPMDLLPTEFGLNFVNSAENPSSNERILRGIAAGAQMDRFPLYWDHIEVGYGQFDWQAQDRALRANEAQGLDTLAILLGTPGHYRTSSRQTNPSPPHFVPDDPPPIGGSFVRQSGAVEAQGGCNAWDGPPAPSGLHNPIFNDGSDRPGPGKQINRDNPWARFVHAAVERYRPGGSAGLHIRHWEIWNEPDLCHFWSGTPEEYARLLKVAYLAIKQSDPQAVVLWGGLAHFDNGQFLYDMLDALQAQPMAREFAGFFDAAASHHYSLSYLGYQYTTKIRNALDAAGWPDKPIWITESGVPVCDDYPGPNCPSPWRASPQEQAAYIWQNVAYTRLAGGGPIFHFMLHDDCGNVVDANSPDAFGLVKNEASSFCSPANAEARPAYKAFQLASQYFPDTELAWADIQNGVRRVAFYHPATNERRLLVWALTQEETLGQVPAAGTEARRIALNGSETTISAVENVYALELPGITNRNWPNEDGGYDPGIYGVPYLMVERDDLPPVATMTPLPELSLPTFIVSWQVRDWGSGVESATLWVQVNEGGWQRWQEDIPSQGSAQFTGEIGQHFRFGISAVDRAGNKAATPVALTATEVSERANEIDVSGRVLDPRGDPVAGVTVRIGETSAVSDDAGHFAMIVTRGAWDVYVADQRVNRQRDFQQAAQLLLLYSPAPNAVSNGDFEEDLTGWTTGGSVPPITRQQPDTDDHALHLATTFVPNPGVPGEEGSEGGNSTVFQRVQVPTGHPYLAFAYMVETQESEPGHDKFEVIVAQEGRAADYVLVQWQSTAWRYQFLDMNRYAGQEIQLTFNVYQTSPNRPTSARVDRVLLSDTNPAWQTLVPTLFLPMVVK